MKINVVHGTITISVHLTNRKKKTTKNYEVGQVLGAEIFIVKLSRVLGCSTHNMSCEAICRTPISHSQEENKKQFNQY